MSHVDFLVNAKYNLFNQAASVDYNYKSSVNKFKIPNSIINEKLIFKK